MVVRCIRSLVILASVIRYVRGLLNIPEYHSLIAVVEYVGAHYKLNGIPLSSFSLAQTALCNQEG